MSQRNSGYARKENDLYETPDWVTQCLVPFIVSPILGKDEKGFIWEPACGSGQMLGSLYEGLKYRSIDIDLHGSDIETDLFVCTDFLGDTPRCAVDDITGIVTNPPYNLAQAFIEKALMWTERTGGFVAMLLRVDFDSAKTRRHLFADNPAWSKKIVLTDRIRWFEGGSSPSFNHAWYLWDHNHEGPATIHYAGKR